VHEVLGNLGGQTTGEPNESLGMACEGFEIGARLIVESFEMSVRNQLEQVLVSLEVFGQDAQMKVVFTVLGFSRFLETGAGRDVEFATDEGFEVGGFRGVKKLDRAEEIAVISQGYGGHAELFGAGHETVDFAGAVQQAVVGMDVEVDEIGGGERHGMKKQEAAGRLSE